MLIEFSVSNFRSIHETQTISMAASKYYKEKIEDNSFVSGISSLPRLLRSAVIYGPNAAGKSTLVMALAFMRGMVVNSASKSQEGEEIEVTPFLLDSKSREKGSEFEIFFVEEGVRYQYGFVINTERILREWMIAYPKGRPQYWFDREFNPLTSKYNYEFGDKFLGGRRRDDWSMNTRGNALFLSTAILLNNEQLKPAFHWFQKRLRILEPHTSLGPGYTAKICEKEEARNRIVEFLNEHDIGISDIIIEKRKFSVDDLPSDIPDELKEELKKDLEGKDLTDIYFAHKQIDSDEKVLFSPFQESHGTRNLFSFAGPWQDVVDNDRVLIVDELDTSLHPLIVHHLVKLLHKDGESKAQLIFTTHDTTILSQEIMRRDQIWFVEKSKGLSTTIYPFSDFNVRANEAWEKGYLQGRYGAIPFIRTTINHGQK